MLYGKYPDRKPKREKAEMPRIKQVMGTQEYASLSSDPFRLANREANDCTVVAISIACHVTYDVAHAALAAQGRKNGRGTFAHQQKAAIESLGYEITTEIWSKSGRQQIIDLYPGSHKKLQNITTHHPRRFHAAWKQFCGDRVVLLYSKGHVSAVKDGQLHDWAINRALRVKKIWIVEKVAS